MIFAEATREGVGVSLFGDSRDFRSLHETVHALLGQSHMTEDQQNTILNFAYELRHGYQGDREVLDLGIDEHEMGKYLSIKLTWPEILFDVGYLRQIAGYGGSDKEHQSNIYRLEYSIESALIKYDTKVGHEAISEYRRLRWFSSDYLTSYLSECCFQYIYGGGKGKMRFRRLPSLLRSFDELSDQYREYHEFMWAEANKFKTHPINLHDTREWVDFEW